MNNLALCESKSLREESIKSFSQDKALETLDKAKALMMALYQGASIATSKQIAEYFEVPIETVSSLVKSHRQEFDSDGLRVIQGKELLEHKLKLHLCSNDARLTIWTPRAALRCGMLLRDSVVAKQVRTVLLDVAQGKESIDKLEQQFLPEVPLKQIDEYASIMGKRFGAGYEQRVLVQSLQKFYPHLPIPPAAPEELVSLPTAKALLTPTQIATQLGFFCKSNPTSPDPRQVNKLLEELGYQTKVTGAWSATNKAIDLDLCDRKPVQTGSRSQKDQLLWSVDIISILQEHSISVSLWFKTLLNFTPT